MKRFFCTHCQKVKRVRTFPPNVTALDSKSPEERHGTCRWHDPTFNNAQPIETNRHRGQHKKKERKRGSNN
jgi:hypothetical protein